MPIYSACSSLSNLQDWRRRDFYIMVLISCTAYAANKRSNVYFIDRSDIVSAIGAVVVGALGNAYSRLTGGNAFICMVTGILFLVPVSARRYVGSRQNLTCVIGSSRQLLKPEVSRKIINHQPNSTALVLVWLFVWLQSPLVSRSVCS